MDDIDIEQAVKEHDVKESDYNFLTKKTIN